ncbi:MAG: Holliday junction resolvase RuvX [Deltaproteobacteria bacterium]|nr:MAG: Holliday junction resolvase RuvX [Deltaproteobacteria bacterium]
MNEQQDKPRVIALDLGKARVGVAVSDDLGLLAHPRSPLPGGNQKRLLEALLKLAQAEQADRFLVGLPMSMSGEHGVAAQRAARFCQRLAETTGLEVEAIDERLTSVQAERRLAEAGASRGDIHARIDGEAAAILLQQWLDQQRDPAEND